MKITAHRGLWQGTHDQNSLAALEAARKQGFGVETDLRSYHGRIYLSHDPILNPHDLPRLDSLLEIWAESRNLPLFLNVKEDGLVPLLAPYYEALQSLQAIFFDMSVPELLRYSQAFPPAMLATRFSEYEPHPAAAEFCDWLWVDGFKKNPNPENLRPFIQLQGKSVAIVSPEIHGRAPKETWNLFHQALWIPENKLVLCTDRAQECHDFLTPDEFTPQRKNHDQSHSF